VRALGAAVACGERRWPAAVPPRVPPRPVQNDQRVIERITHILRLCCPGQFEIDCDLIEHSVPAGRVRLLLSALKFIILRILAGNEDDSGSGIRGMEPHASC